MRYFLALSRLKTAAKRHAIPETRRVRQSNMARKDLEQSQRLGRPLPNLAFTSHRSDCMSNENRALRSRLDFSKIPTAIQIPNLIEVQRRSL